MAVLLEPGTIMTFMPDIDTPNVISICIPATVIEARVGKRNKVVYDIRLSNGRVVRDVPQQQLAHE